MTTPQGLAVSAAHDAAQARLLDRALAELTLAWSTILDPRDLDASSRLYVPVAAEVVRANRAAASQVATTFYNALRDVETASMRNVAPYAAAVAEEPATALLRTSLEVTGPVTTKASMVRGMILEEALTRGLTATLGAATRHIEGGPRDVTRLNARRDPAAGGWNRRSGGTPCPFCAMLISRGPVDGSARGTYRSEASASFKAHDHCHCKAVAYFGSDTGWTQQSSEFAELWKASNGQLYGGEKSFSAVYRARHPRIITPKDTRRAADRSNASRKAAETRKAAKATPVTPDAPLAPVVPIRPATTPSLIDVPEPANLLAFRAQLEANRPRWARALERRKRGAKTQLARHDAYLDSGNLTRHAPETDLVEALPRLTGEHTPDDLVQMTNPLYLTDPRAQINCVHVANTFELQRRGYAVTATPLPRSQGSNGRDSQEALLRWRDKNGDGRMFTDSWAFKLTDTLADEWPDGARGFVTVRWRGGGGHIFNAEKVDGRIVYYEAQSRTPITFDGDYGRRTANATGAVKYARVDDLTPSNDVLEFVQEGAAEWTAILKARKAAAKTAAS